MRPALSVTVLALLAACAQQPEQAATQPEPLVSWSALTGGGTGLGAYLERLRGMNEAKLTAEAARQRALAGRDTSDLARVKAALALTLAPHADEADILALVDPVIARQGNSGEVSAMASFLHAMAMDRRRLKESAAAAGTRLAVERRAREAEKQRADTLQARAEELQQKLDALSSLEKSLSDRPTPSR